MLTHGTDRARRVGDRVILQSSLPKGWTPRVPKTLTNAEHPGTTVLWGEEYFEVVEAEATPTGGVRYMLMPWREEHTIRTIEQYDEASEAALLADHARVQKQRRSRLTAILSGMFLGYLPAPVQMHLENELGVRAPRMTILSCLLSLVMFAACLMLTIDARMRHEEGPVPLLVWIVVLLLAVEAVVRFFVAMSQDRPMGSFFGVIGHTLYHAISTKSLRAPTLTRGNSVAFIEPAVDVALNDSFKVQEPLLTLLSPAEQVALAQRFAFDYRRTGFVVAWVILAVSAVGAVSSSSPLSMLIAAAVVLEQAGRIYRMRTAPAGSMFAVVVRPLARNLLRG
jgi:hypothetical protein